MIELTRNLEIKLKKLLTLFPVVAIIGVRQCGKTTLAKQFKYDHYFDLENPRDIVKLEQPQLTLELLRGLIIIDEILFALAPPAEDLLSTSEKLFKIRFPSFNSKSLIIFECSDRNLLNSIIVLDKP